MDNQTLDAVVTAIKCRISFLKDHKLRAKKDRLAELESLLLYINDQMR